jgi:hypothetical protein
MSTSKKTTAKIVFNACHGGFSLSPVAILRAREITGNPKWGGAVLNGDETSWGIVMDWDSGCIEGVERHDPILVQVVEELGSKASGISAALEIEVVPYGAAYRIDDYDGLERVVLADDQRWYIAAP